jgi:hypothetical protein
VIVEAEPGDPSITSLGFDRCFSVHFDHLIVLEKREPQTAGDLVPRLVLELVDGTRLVGYYSGDPILASVPRQNMDLSLDDILSMQLQRETNVATIPSEVEEDFGQVRFSARVTTIVGERGFLVRKSGT